MEFAFLKEIKRTRKKHSCICCGRIIDEGEKCYNNVGKSNGDFYSCYLCECCELLYREMDLDWSDGINGFGEEISEFVSDVICPCGGAWGDLDYDTKEGTITLECEECEEKIEMTLIDFIKRVKKGGAE